MANEPVKRPLGAPAEQPMTPRQQELLKTFRDAFEDLKERASGAAGEDLRALCYELADLRMLLDELVFRSISSEAPQLVARGGKLAN